MEKICSSCKEAKGSNDFYVSRSSRDGLSTSCRPCVRLKSRLYIEANRDSVNARKRASNARNREQRTRYMAEYRAKNPAIRKAWRAVETGLYNGSLIRPSLCEECQRTCKPEAAHVDYSRPLDIRWLCRTCHIEFDRKNGHGPLKNRDEEVTMKITGAGAK